MDTVSVIIPYYNRPKKLDRCLASVFAQTYPNVEVIVIDDCSIVPPNRLDTSIRYHKNETNLGPGPSRNEGIKHASGTYITFLDCDDYWHPDFIQKTMAQLKTNSEAVMAYANGEKVDGEGNTIALRKNRIVLRSSIIPDILKIGRPWGTGGCLWVAKEITDVCWRASFTWEDYAFDIDVGLCNNKIVGIPEVLVFYNSEGADKLSHQHVNQEAVRKQPMLVYISERLLEHGWVKHPETRKAMQLQLFYQLISLQTSGQSSKKLNHELLQAIKAWSTKWKAWYTTAILLLPRHWRLRVLRTCRKQIKTAR